MCRITNFPSIHNNVLNVLPPKKVQRDQIWGRVLRTSEHTVPSVFCCSVNIACDWWQPVTIHSAHANALSHATRKIKLSYLVISLSILLLNHIVIFNGFYVLCRVLAVQNPGTLFQIPCISCNNSISLMQFIQNTLFFIRSIFDHFKRQNNDKCL